jgi:hypothetical protein
VPLLGLPAGNPPAAIGVGYCIMDALARQLAPHLPRALASIRHHLSRSGRIGSPSMDVDCGLILRQAQDERVGVARSR